MQVKKSKFSAIWIAFPLAALLAFIYKIAMDGTEIKASIANFNLFSTYIFMIILEFAFKYKHHVTQKAFLLRDIVSTLVHTFVTGRVTSFIFIPAVAVMVNSAFGRGLVFVTPQDAGPLWLQVIAALLLFSLMRYTVHYLQHRIGFLWQLHSYHHSVTDIHTSNTLVSHPLDYALRNILPPVALAVVGFEPYAVLLGAGIVGTFSVFSHCGAGLHAGWLNHIFVTPELHRWHHSVKVPEGYGHAVNYGVGFILWDRLFGTYYLPMKDGVPLQPERLGHPEGVADEKNYLKIFFLTRFWPKFMKPKES